MKNVDVIIIHPCDEGQPEDRVKVDEYRARALIDGGVAVAATKPDARKAGVDVNTAASVNKS